MSTIVSEVSGSTTMQHFQITSGRDPQHLMSFRSTFRRSNRPLHVIGLHDLIQTGWQVIDPDAEKSPHLIGAGIIRKLRDCVGPLVVIIFHTKGLGAQKGASRVVGVGRTCITLIIDPGFAVIESKSFEILINQILFGVRQKWLCIPQP